MECERANDLMMKYMDGSLGPEEAEKLKEHINACESCREDFKIYDELMMEFKDIEIFDAPEGFEEAVMKKIEALESVAVRATSVVDNIIFGVWGVFSVLFGLGFVLFMNRNDIMAYMSANGMADYVAVLTPFANLVTEYTGNIVYVVSTAGGWAMDMVSQYKFVILAVFAVLAMTQYLISPKMAADDHTSKE